MPIVELECASLHEGSHGGDLSDRGTLGLRSALSYTDHSSTRGRQKGMTGYTTNFDLRSTKSEVQHHDTVNKAFTNFTESLSQSTEGIQDGITKTFSSIVSNFSRDYSNSSSSGTESGGSSSGYSSESRDSQSKKWSEFVFPQQIRNRVSSLTSRSSYIASSSNDSTLSSHSSSPRTNSDRFAITVNNSGLVLRESTDDDSSAGASSVASWQETASRDKSLLDTIGEMNGESDEESDEGSSTSGSESGSESSYSGDEDEGRGGGAMAYDSDGESTAFDSDIGLEDLSAAMLQIGSCHFEPESASMSYDEEDYSFASGLFPPTVSNYLNRKNSAAHQDGDVDELQSEAARNALFQKRLQQRQKKEQKKPDEDIITSLFNKAFSCGGAAQF